MGFPLIISTILMIPGVQTSLVRLVTARLSSDLNTTIGIDRVHISPFSGITLSGFLLLDQQNDTLFYARNLKTGIDRFSIRQKHLGFGNVRVQNPQMNIRELESHELNFAFLLDSLQKYRPDSVIWDYSIQGLRLVNGQMKLQHSQLLQMNPPRESMDVSEINLTLAFDFNRSDTLGFNLYNGRFRKKTGLSVTDFGLAGALGDNRLNIDEMLIKTDHSFCSLNQVYINFGAGNIFDVEFRAMINELIVSPHDIRLYQNEFPAIETPILINGLVYGSLNNLKGRQFSAGFGRNTQLVTSFDVDGLSDFYNAFVYMNIESFQTNVTDLELLIPGEAPQIPAFLNEFQTIQYRGNITGFINDMVAYGTFNSPLGTVSTDVGLKIMPDNHFVFSGDLRTSDFDLGRLLSMEDEMGRIALNMAIDGERKSETDYRLLMDGSISEMEFRKYLYNNISVQGLLTHQMFDGRIDVDDVNGSLDFMGKVDMSGAVPYFDFNAAIRNARLDRLLLMSEEADFVLSLQMNTNFEGDNLDDLVGEIILTEGLLTSSELSLDFDSVSLRASRENGKKRLVLNSPFANGELAGNYSFVNFRKTINAYLGLFLPALVSASVENAVNPNDFEFHIEVLDMSDLLTLIYPELQISDMGFINGKFAPARSEMELDATFDYVNYKNFRSENLEIQAHSNGDQDLTMTARADRAGVGKFVDFSNISIHQKAGKDTLQTNLFWNNWDEVTYSGALYSTSSFRRDSEGERFTSIILHPSSVIMADTLWNIHETIVSVYPKGFSVRGFRIENDGQFVHLNGFLHQEAEDGLNLVFNRLDLSRFLTGTQESDISFAGIIDGEMVLRDYFREPLLSGNVNVLNFEFNDVGFGDLRLRSVWNNELEALAVNASIEKDDKRMLQGFGLFHPQQQHLDFQFGLDSLNIAFLNPFLENVIQNITGTASGQMFLKGDVMNPSLTGKVNLNNGHFDVDFLNTSYALSDSVHFYKNEIRFRSMKLSDRHHREGRFHGSIFHNGAFSDMIYNLRLDANNMLVMNTNSVHNEYYYGRVFGTGTFLVTGTSENVNLTINGRTRPNTRFFIPIQSATEASESNFIRFVGSADYVPGLPTIEPQEYTVDLSGVNLEMDIEITPDAQVQIIFDERIGDILQSSGAGNIQIRINRQGLIRFYGDYTIQEGNYLFSLQNLINKRFVINQGGTLKWQGDPYNADIDITAVYRLRASLSDLFEPTSVGSGANGASDLQRRVQIHCNLHLTDMLQQPVIRFGLEMPTLDETRESLILDYISSEEEMNRQVLSLLVLGRFYTPEYMRMGGAGANTMRHENTALLTTTEMLSSQISRWFSTISSDFDVGVAYRPGDNITSEEFELALSTQVFNNRVSINGNVGYGKYQTNTSKMIGDFDVDVKLNRTGTIRAKAYTRSNEDLLYETSPTTQGIGLSFKEEFDHFRELMQKYWRIIAGRRED
ncbi:translocation/assembly module TamB domain-containing protein [Natronoflexus pectinivorans]|nr:translocation/assembly module TamB domain-containing protein [Natronoflexus pectinivorans]